MDQSDLPTISFAPDGSINDSVILRQIKNSKPLPPKDLLKLGPFFAQIRTYTVLADTLVASALLSQADQSPVADNLETRFNARANDDGIDSFIDTYIENTAEPPNKEDPDDDRKYIPFWHRVLVPGTNVGLLIETTGKRSFAVAVSPDPAMLADD